MRGAGPHGYQDHVVVDLLGKRVHVLDLSREIGPEIPVYPGHMRVATWPHLTHEDVRRLRLPPGSPFGGYGVYGIAMCDHVSTHLDAVFHFSEQRPDLSVDRVPLTHLITPGVWVDVSWVGPRQHIRLADVQRALQDAHVQLRPGVTLLYYTGAARLWADAYRFLTEYPGLDEEASRWILDQGVVNVCTDAPSTDTPADLSYPNHRVHGEREVVHTEIVNNIDRIPHHEGFYVMILPLRFVGLTGSPVRALALWEE